MNYLTKEKFNLIEKENKYFKGRWVYFNEVIEMAKKINPQKILEVGSVGCKLIEESKVVDIRNSY